jgi:hypothetical protein
MNTMSSASHIKIRERKNFVKKLCIGINFPEIRLAKNNIISSNIPPTVISVRFFDFVIVSLFFSDKYT